MVLGPLDIKDTIKALIGAVATAVGVVGLLTVVGGAVTWLRFRELGLPAQTAVALMPNDDLVNLGATGMVIFVGIGVLVVAALFALDPSGRVTPGTFGALVVLFFGLLVYIFLEDDFQTRSKLTLGILAFLLVLACLQVARLTGLRFIPVAVAVFFAVLIFGGAWTYRYESDNTKAQPAAVLRGDEKKGLIGYFVAATDDRIYLARLDRNGAPGGLFDVKRDDTTRLAVGRRIACNGEAPNVECEEAREVAIALRTQLLTDRPPSSTKKSK